MSNSNAKIGKPLSTQALSPNGTFSWLAPVRMLVITFIAFGYASTMPRGPDKEEYLHVFGYDPSWYGLSVIFMISGFLAMRSLDNHGSARKFLVTRIGRNLPILALFALLVIFVLYPVFGVPMGDGGTRFKLFSQYFIKVVSCFDPNTVTPGLLDNALYMCVIQGGLWTFRWGLVIYLATALVWSMGGLRSRNIVASLFLGSMIIYATLAMYAAKNPVEVLELPITGLRLGWIYLAGMCVCMFREQLSRSVIIPAVFIGLAAVQFFILPWTPFIEISMTLGISYLVFIAMTARKSAPSSISKLPDLSLGLFVFNWPMAQIVLLLVPSLGPLGLFAISFPLTILLSLICWALITRPSLSLLGSAAAA